MRTAAGSVTVSPPPASGSHIRVRHATGAAARSRRGGTTMTIAAISVAAVSVAALAVFLHAGPAPAAGQLLGDVAILVAAGMAALGCARAARRGGPDARGWTLLSIAAAVWAVAQIVWTLYGITRDHVYPFPSVADIGFLGYAVPAAAGLLAFSRVPVRRLTWIRGLVDGLLISTALLFTSWAVVLGPLTRAAGVRNWSDAVGLAYPLVDGAMATLVLVLAGGRAPADRLPWLVLGGGLLTLTVTDSLYVTLTLTGYTGLTASPLTFGWLAAFLLVTLATLVPAVPVAPRRVRLLTIVQELLPWLPVGAAVIVAAVISVADDRFQVWTGLAVFLLAGLRQVLTVVDKVALTHELEARVQQRTAELLSAREDLQQTFDNAPIGMAWAGLSGTLTQVNPTFCRMLGRNAEELIGSSVADITFPADRIPTEHLLSGAVRTPHGGAIPIAKRYLHADGSAVWTEGSASVTRGQDGAPRTLVAQVQDVTARRAATRALADQAMFLEAVLENLDSGVVACDAQGRLTVFNRASREALGQPLVELTPESWSEHYELFRADGVTPMPMQEIPLFRALRGDRVDNADLVIAPKGGEPHLMVCNGRRIHDGDGAVVGAVVAMQDVTARRKAEAALVHQALHDPLTDLANRALLRDRLGHAIARQARQPEPLALLLLDLDGFKLVNDSLGHPAGDEVLVVLAERLRAALRPYDTIARLGGDEFAVVLENTGEQPAVKIAAKILTVLREPVVVDGHAISSDASIGVVVSSGTDSPESLLRNADLAMYAAKEQGKGSIEVFAASMHEAVLQRLILETELREAVDTCQFALVYQPIVSLLTGRLQGFEALVRWNHPRRGVVLPSEFIPLAEASGLIVPLGSWVLREACRMASRWSRTHPDAQGLVMSVNVSVRQLQDLALLDVVVAALAAAGLGAGQLQLEITESALDQGKVTRTVLERIHAVGVHLALDDFGTGYSSLSRLHALPIDRLKIDKSFVDELAGGGTAPMVAATVAMAHSLGLQAVAEGVESADQLPYLRLHGCDDVQGYLFGRPLNSGAIDALLDRRGTGELWTSLASGD